MRVAPWDKHLIKIELDGNQWYSMVVDGIQCVRSLRRTAAPTATWSISMAGLLTRPLVILQEKL